MRARREVEIDERVVPVTVQCAMCELYYDIEDMNDVDEYCVCDYCLEDGCECE